MELQRDGIRKSERKGRGGQVSVREGEKTEEDVNRRKKGEGKNGQLRERGGRVWWKDEEEGKDFSVIIVALL